MNSFTTSYPAIKRLIAAINPIAYASTRNYVQGKVTYLSPYLSRGVISTQQILQHLLQQKYTFQQVEVLVRELAWRDYYQRVWQAKGTQINQDMFPGLRHFTYTEMPTALVTGQTGITAIDEAIANLYQTGYMHNHCRMYTAAIACNIAQTHWQTPAKWMYYHLLDGDWASNALSWQWVAGTFSRKIYVANQENINQYTGTTQYHTWLDVPYTQLPPASVPQVLQQRSTVSLQTPLPSATEHIDIQPNWPTLIYNYYNIDPNWHAHTAANRILLLEPALFQQYPVGEKPLQWALQLAQNIPGLQYFVGNFNALTTQLGNSTCIYKEHPLNQHYTGIMEDREWMVPEVKGYFPSFFQYWKKIVPILKKQFNA